MLRFTAVFVLFIATPISAQRGLEFKGEHNSPRPRVEKPKSGKGNAPISFTSAPKHYSCRNIDAIISQLDADPWTLVNKRQKKQAMSIVPKTVTQPMVAKIVQQYMKQMKLDLQYLAKRCEKDPTGSCRAARNIPRILKADPQVYLAPNMEEGLIESLPDKVTPMMMQMVANVFLKNINKQLSAACSKYQVRTTATTKATKATTTKKITKAPKKTTTTTSEPETEATTEDSFYDTTEQYDDTTEFAAVTRLSDEESCVLLVCSFAENGCEYELFGEGSKPIGSKRGWEIVNGKENRFNPLTGIKTDPGGKKDGNFLVATFPDPAKIGRVADGSHNLESPTVAFSQTQYLKFQRYIATEGLQLLWCQDSEGKNCFYESTPLQRGKDSYLNRRWYEEIVPVPEGEHQIFAIARYDGNKMFNRGQIGLSQVRMYSDRAGRRALC